MTDKQSVFLLCCKIDKRKNTSYLSNNCKYDVFYNYVKILNLMTLAVRRLFFLGRRPAVDYVDYIERKIAIPQKTESAESVPGY